MMKTILEVKDLVTYFDTLDGTIHAANGISFDLQEGETLAIVGESGCGKSVTMLSILGLIPQPPGVIESGRALYHDGQQTVDLLSLSNAEIRKIRGAQIGMIFQDPMTSLNPVLSIGLQIAEALMEHKGMSIDEAEKETLDLLKYVGIPSADQRYGNYPHQFSGGMRQRVMIAMAIACMPRILIADEPTTALDVTVQAQIIDLVKHLRDELKLAVIWITHDLGVVAGLADRVLVMYGGLAVEEAPLEDLYASPKHPYTIGLLGALPRLDRIEEARLANIEGTPPDLLVAPRSCQFAPRCEHAFDRCWEEVPPAVAVGDRHWAACFFDVDRGRPRNDG
jgi:oligopeptide transport system ATP-binding protein